MAVAHAGVMDAAIAVTDELVRHRPDDPLTVPASAKDVDRPRLMPDLPSDVIV
jgi:hypothetical protein